MNFSESEQIAGRKVAGITLVVALHALLAYALLTGLGTVVLKMCRQEVPITLEPEQDEATVTKVPAMAPPSPTLAPAQIVELPRPDFVVAASPLPALPGPSMESGEGAEHGAGAGEGSGLGVGQGQGLGTVNAVVDFGSCQKPEYPASALRNEEQGVSHLLFLIDTNGSIAEARVDKTSGYKALDSAALRALSLCRFKPGTVNGQAQKTWASVDYAWRLTQ